MRELLYSALDIAAIVGSMKLDCCEESRIIGQIWEGEKPFLEECYRIDKRKFLLDVYYWHYYFLDKPTIDSEFPIIQKELSEGEVYLDEEQYTSDFKNLDLFFKSLRIRILYGKGNDYVRLKLRSLLKVYGYRRRSQLLLWHIDRCMLFYHLEATLKGGEPCDLAVCGLDNMIIFRAV